jgi:hypothetical protein
VVQWPARFEPSWVEGAIGRGEIVGFRTSVIYQRVHNTVLTRLP